MKVSVEELQSILDNLPTTEAHLLDDTEAHLLDDLDKLATYYNDDGTRHPSRIITLKFQKNADRTKWDLLWPTEPSITSLR